MKEKSREPELIVHHSLQVFASEEKAATTSLLEIMNEATELANKSKRLHPWA